MSNNEICGYISLLYSIANKPLHLWSKHISFGGKICRVQDDTLHGDKVIEIIGPHDSSIPTNITIPAKTLDVLNIKFPILILIIKNLSLRFKLEVQIIDKKQYRRRFSFMTYNLEKLPSINANVARIPLKLEECWNFLEINLQTLCHEAYGTDYKALQRIIIYPNCHLRRIYLQDRHYNHDEIPTEMYQAFFDMYMLKWGINFIERACQTENHTGFVEQSDLNCFAKNNPIKIPSTKTDLFKNVHSMGKLENLNPSGTMVNLCNSNTLRRNHMSLDILNNTKSEIKVLDNQNMFIRQSQHFIKSLVNDPIIKNKIKTENNNTIEKEEKRNAMKIHEARNLNSLMNSKINNHMLQGASSIQLNSITKKQFLKTHDKMFKNNKFPKRSYSQRIQNAGDTYINSRNCTLSNSNNNVQIKNNLNSTNAKLGVSVAGFPSSSKLDKISNKVSDTRINELNIISKEKYVKENDKSVINHLRFLDNVQESAEDKTENISECIPSLIEKEAKLDEVKSRSMYLTTDTAVSDFVAARHSVNKRLIEKLRNKGFTIPQIELSIYNVINQRHFYSQEKFIEKQRWCIDKCIGL